MAIFVCLRHGAERIAHNSRFGKCGISQQFVPAWQEAERERLSWTDRQRAI